MRSFEERKEEIFRRSEKKIAQRKKTVRRVLVSCVPLVLCVSVLSGIWLLRGPVKMDNAAPEANGSPNYGMVADSEMFAQGADPGEAPQVPEMTPSVMAPATTGADNTKENTPASGQDTPPNCGEHRPLYQDEVIEEAAELIDWEYDTVTAEQDRETGEWTVTFWAQNGEDFQAITVGRYGGILGSETGTLVGCN